MLRYWIKDIAMIKMLRSDFDFNREFESSD